MKAHKINLANYDVPNPENVPGKPPNPPIKFQVADSMANLLFQPALQLNGVALLEQQKLANKFMDNGEEVLLDAQDYSKLKHAVQIFKGFARPHVELVRRVLEAPEVEVDEVKEAVTQEE